MSDAEQQGTTRQNSGNDIGTSVSQGMRALGEGASDLAQQGMAAAKQAASDGAGTIGSQITDMLDERVRSGGEMMGQFSNSARAAADELQEQAPQAARLVRGVAERLDRYANDLRGRSAADLLGTFSDFTRRQPGLVFGLSAIAGAVAFRALKSTPASSPSRMAAGQPPRMAAGQPRTGDFNER